MEKWSKSLLCLYYPLKFTPLESSTGTHKSRLYPYIIVLVIFTIVYFVILFLLESIHSMTYNGLFYLFNEAGIGASTIAFVGGGLVAFLFLKSRGREV